MKIRNLKNKAQVAQTTNWIVATIIIIVILLISLFLANGDWFEKGVKFKDKQKDFVATKSITGFLSEEKNINILKNSVEEKNYSLFDEKFRPLLEKLSYDSKNGIWMLNINVDKGVFSEHFINIAGTLSKENFYFARFNIYSNNKNIELSFWKEEILQI